MSAIPGDFEVGGTGLGETTTALYIGNGTSNTITLLNNNGSVTSGQTVTFDPGGIPSGLTPGTIYYIVDQSSNTFRISGTPGGAPIDIGDGGGLLVIGDIRIASLEGDVFIGGELGYIEKISKEGVHLDWLECKDDDDNLMKVMGITVGPDGEPYSALKPMTGPDKDFQPHDLSYDFANDRLVVILSKLDNTALIRIMSLDMITIIAEFTGIDVDAGWTQDIPLKIVVDCSGETAYYTDQGDTIFRYDLIGAGAQLTPYAEQPVGSPYMFADLDILIDDKINVDETGSGHGPRRAVTLGSNDFSWSDRISPPTGIHKIWKMRVNDHIDVIDYAVSLDPGATNNEITTAAAYYLRCVEAEIQKFFVVATVIGAN